MNWCFINTLGILRLMLLWLKPFSVSPAALEVYFKQLPKFSAFSEMKEGGQEHIVTSGVTSGVLFSSHFGVASQLLRSGVVVRKVVTYCELVLLPRSLIPHPGTSSVNRKEGVFCFCKDLKNYHQVSSLSSWNLLKIGETFLI